MNSINWFTLFTLTMMLSYINAQYNGEIRYNPQQFDNEASSTYNDNDHWTQYYTMNDTHTCNTCYNGQGADKY